MIAHRLARLAGAALLATTLMATAANVAPAGADSAVVPNTVVMDGQQLEAIRQHPDPAALAFLVHRANDALRAGPWSVMDKAGTVSPDKHDYFSLATYWWPSEPKTPDNPWGCPYVQKDGQWAPDVATSGDLKALHDSWSAISDLSLAWFYTGDADYAQRAELDVRTWFLDPATRMNPNMNYAQALPCGDHPEGRNFGIIESSQAITEVLDALAILDSGAPGWSGADQTAIRDWLSQYQDWMRNSAFGRAETDTTNNHGTWKDLQDAAIALYLGDTTFARNLVQSTETNRIAKQIDNDGSQPGELSRTRPWHYSNFNLQAFCRLAEVGRHVGIDLWAYHAPNGATLDKAADFLIPGAVYGGNAWLYPDLDKFDQSLAKDKLHAAAEQGNDPAARAAVDKVPLQNDLWPVEPACWQDLSQPPTDSLSQLPPPPVETNLDFGRRVFQPGSTASVSVKLANNRDLAMEHVALSITPPDGWGVAPASATTFGAVPPNTSVTATWQLSAPAGAQPGRQPVSAHTAFTFGTAPLHTSAASTVIVPGAAQPIAAARNNVGISDDADTDVADFDGAGSSLSAEALAAAGVTAGSTVTHGGVAFTWPDVPAGAPDNVVASGQSIELSGSGSTLGLLATSTYGATSGDGAVLYSDGSASDFTISVPDWYAKAPSGSDAAITMTYRNRAGNVSQQHDIHVFFVGVPLDKGKTVTGVVLPDVSTAAVSGQATMHVFAFGIG